VWPALWVLSTGFLAELFCAQQEKKAPEAEGSGAFEKSDIKAKN
jgi:hypothetical protein